MKKILLTSTGFENENIKNKFMELVAKDASDIKVLFVITAAIDPDAILVLPKCLNDLINCNIPKENITVFNMHEEISEIEINKYDAIYVCGGETNYLVKRMNEANFIKSVEQFIKNGGVFVGVSAGAIAACGVYENGLNFIENRISVHCESGSNNGIIKNKEDIFLSNNQAILITDDEAIIFE